MSQLIELVRKNNSDAALASASTPNIHVTQPHTARTTLTRGIFVVRKCFILFKDNSYFYSLVFNVSAAGLYQENKTQTYFTLLSQSVNNPKNVFICFSSRSMTFTQFNYGASPWRHLALLLTALALTAPVKLQAVPNDVPYIFGYSELASNGDWAAVSEHAAPVSAVVTSWRERSCATLRSTMKSGQRIPWLCLFAPCGAMVFSQQQQLSFIFLIKACGQNVEYERIKTV